MQCSSFQSGDILANGTSVAAFYPQGGSVTVTLAPGSYVFEAQVVVFTVSPALGPKYTSVSAKSGPWTIT